MRRLRWLDLFFPPKCAFCGQVLPRTGGRVCPRCRKRLPYHRSGEKKCDFVPYVAAPLYYEGQVRQSLHRYKFNSRESYAGSYAELLAETLGEERERFDTLSWVPLHPKRRRERGFDQSERLARELGARLGMEPVALLAKVRNTPPQSLTGDAAARRANISGCYAMEAGAVAEGRRILLVDDILTTGATLSECARILKLNGAEEVCGAVVACSRDS